jgi:hypothetical protein
LRRIRAAFKAEFALRLRCVYRCIRVVFCATFFALWERYNFVIISI